MKLMGFKSLVMNITTPWSRIRELLITTTANGSKLAEQEAESSRSSPARSMATDGLPDGVEGFAVKMFGYYYPTPHVPSGITAAEIRSALEKEYSCIDIHEEDILNMKRDDSARNCYVISDQEKQPRLTMFGPVVEYMERAVGSLFSSSYTYFPALSWVTTIVETAKIVGFASAAAGYGMRDYSDKGSRILIKGGAIATGTAVIASLAMPLPPVVAWTVGPVACLAVAAAVVSN